MSLLLGRDHLGPGGDIGVEELGPTPHTLHNDAARRHWVEIYNLRETFGEGGLEILVERPPDPGRQGVFAVPTPREIRIPCLIFPPPGIEKQLKHFL